MHAGSEHFHGEQREMNELNSDDEKEGHDLSKTIPGQFIVTEKELDQKLYEQFMTEQEWIDPQPDYAGLIRQGE
jgi:hypothetical protein